MKSITLAISGSSGIPYTIALLKALARQPDVFIHGLISNAAREVFRYEAGLVLPSDINELNAYFYNNYQIDAQKLKFYALNDWGAPIASGSAVPDAMVVCPCSMSSLASISQGNGSNLIHRAADVIIKEQRKLILVVRETPLSVIHLENMLKLARVGATILPANPGFYHRPQHMDDLINFVAGRILQQLNIPQDLIKSWGSA